MMLIQDLSNSSLTCSSCGHVFPPGLTEIPCPKCGGTAFTQSTSPESENDSGPLAFHVSVRRTYSLDHISAAAIFTRQSSAIENAFDFGRRNENEALVMASIFAAT